MLFLLLGVLFNFARLPGFLPLKNKTNEQDTNEQTIPNKQTNKKNKAPTVGILVDNATHLYFVLGVS